MRFGIILSLVAIVAATIVRADPDVEDVLTLEVVREEVPDLLGDIVNHLDSDIGETVTDSVEDIFEALFGVEDIFDEFEKRDLNKLTLAREMVQRNKGMFAKRENEKDEDVKDEDDKGKRSVYKRESEKDEDDKGKRSVYKRGHERDENERDENERDENECDENERD
ncbi:hypothetical protein BJV82DRAFT_606952, partial [Fennellomyces sp. T-0311]